MCTLDCEQSRTTCYRVIPSGNAEGERLAAEKGIADAQFNLGLMYGNGEGVPQDYVQAYMWLNLAVVQGHENARKGRDIVYKNMTPEQIVEAQRLAREWKPKK